MNACPCAFIAVPAVSRHRFGTVAFRLLPALLGMVFAGHAFAQSNNNFANRTRLTGDSITAPTVSTVGGNRESGEPTHPGASTETLWWEWVAPQTGTYTLDTDGSAIDTSLAVYEGTALNQLQRVVASDNPPGTTRARVTLTTAAGTAYQIVVAPGNTTNGNVILKITYTGPAAAPSYTGTDAFNNRPRLTAAAFLGQTECSSGASREPSEPTHAGGASTETSWWQWTAPGNGNATIDLVGETVDGAQLDTVLNVYAGSEINLLTRVAYNDNAPGTIFSRLTFPTSAGQVYQLVAAPSSTATGTFRLSLNYTAAPTQPPALAGTDDFLRRPTLSEGNAWGVGETTGASRQTGEPSHTGASTETLWWQWIAPAQGTLIVDTAGSALSNSSAFDTIVFVYTGTVINQLGLAASNDNAPGLVTSKVSLTVQAGTAYQIMVAPSNTTNGNVSLALEFQPASGPQFAITQQPQSQAVPVGASATVTVGATGPSLTYQWQFRNGDIAGATGTSYTISSMTATNAGSYHAIVRSAGQSLTSNDAVLSVIATPVPGIDIPPRLLPAGATVTEARAVVEQPNRGVLVAVSGLYTSAASGTVQAKSHPAPRTAASIAGVAPDDVSTPPIYSLSQVFRLTNDGKKDLSFTSAPGAKSTINPTATINALAIDSAEKILVVGSFDSFHDKVYFRNIARLNVDGTADESFNQTGTGTDAPVNAVAVQGDGKILIGGTFRTYGDRSWPYLVRLNRNGSVDEGFKPTLNNAVNAIAVQADGSIIVGGNFTSPRSHIARLRQATGDVDSSFNPPAAASESVVALVLQKDESIIVSGEAIQNRARIVRLLPTGAVDPNFLSTVAANSTVFSLGMQEDGKILAGGAFTEMNNTPRMRLARLNSNGALDPTFDPAGGANQDVHALLPRKDGSVFLAGLFTEYQGKTADGVLAVVGSATVVQPPVILVHPQSETVTVGSSVTFDVTATGISLTYQWQYNTTDISGATNPAFSISAAAANAGSYRVLVKNSAGTVTSGVATLTVNPAVAPVTGRLGNLSVRTTAGTGNDILIVGFSVAGGRKQLLIRGIGPTLASFGVTNALADPALTLLQGQSQVTSNDNWGGSATLENAFAAVGAFPLSRTSLDAALYVPLDNGGYTVQMTGKTGAIGIGLLELYDADKDARARLVNISARSQVGTGDGVLIVGFNVTDGPITLLVRGVGPTLGSLGVGGVLADPKLQVFRGETNVAEDDNWDPSLAGIFGSVGAFDLIRGSRDAALRVTLPPGGYTARVSGVNSTTGVALVEVYALP